MNNSYSAILIPLSFLEGLNNKVTDESVPEINYGGGGLSGYANEYI